MTCSVQTTIEEAGQAGRGLWREREPVGGTVDAVLSAMANQCRWSRLGRSLGSGQGSVFNFTSCNGFYSDDKYWIEHLDIPMGYIRDYAKRVAAGDDIDRPTAEISAERDRITAE